LIGGHLDALGLCPSVPQEDMRMTVPRIHLEQHIITMKEHIVAKLSELVFDLDEVASSELEDRKPKKAIAPQVVSPDDIYRSVARRYRHMTLLACISAAGDAPTFWLLAQRG
jgi:hypothetical protein